jgi:hypothetical protein
VRERREAATRAETARRRYEQHQHRVAIADLERQREFEDARRRARGATPRAD